MGASDPFSGGAREPIGGASDPPAIIIAGWLKYRRFQVFSPFQLPQVFSDGFFRIFLCVRFFLANLVSPFQNPKKKIEKTAKINTKTGQKQKKSAANNNFRKSILHALEDAGIWKL